VLDHFRLNFILEYLRVNSNKDYMLDNDYEGEDDLHSVDFEALEAAARSSEDEDADGNIPDGAPVPTTSHA
jgi:hypothetical protein